MTVLTNKIVKRIRGHGRGKWVCTPKDFLDLGTRAAVDQTLSRLVKRGQLRRVGRGLYDLPRMSQVLKKTVPVDLDASVQAIARRYSVKVMSDGLVAANQLGLTNAVPAKASYWTDGATRQVHVGQRTLQLKHVKPSLMQWDNRVAGPVVSALMWLGPTLAKDSNTIDQLRRQLPDDVKQDLLSGIAQLPAWAIPIVRQLQPVAAMG